MFKSRYIPEDKEITAAQYLAELICERIATKKGVALVTRFWNKKEWTKTFTAQLVHANKLLRDYSDVKIIVKALNSFNGKQVYSLGARYILNDLIEFEIKKASKEKKEAPAPNVDISDLPSTRKQFKRKSILDEL